MTKNEPFRKHYIRAKTEEISQTHQTPIIGIMKASKELGPSPKVAFTLLNIMAKLSHLTFRTGRNSS